MLHGSGTAVGGSAQTVCEALLPGKPAEETAHEAVSRAGAVHAAPGFGCAVAKCTLTIAHIAALGAALDEHVFHPCGENGLCRVLHALLPGEEHGLRSVGEEVVHILQSRGQVKDALAVFGSGHVGADGDALRLCTAEKLRHVRDFHLREHKNAGEAYDARAFGEGIGNVLRTQSALACPRVGEKAALAARMHQHHVDAGGNIGAEAQAMGGEAALCHVLQHALPGGVGTQQGIQRHIGTQMAQHQSLVQSVAPVAHDYTLGGL